jgi:hypothetical protein
MRFSPFWLKMRMPEIMVEVLVGRCEKWAG